MRAELTLQAEPGVDIQAILFYIYMSEIDDFLKTEINSQFGMHQANPSDKIY